MGFFKKITQAVSKPLKKVEKAAKKVSPVHLTKTFYDKNKKGIKEWGKVGLEAGAAYFTGGASLAMTQGGSLGGLLGGGGAQDYIDAATQDYMDAYNQPDAPQIPLRPADQPSVVPSSRINGNMQRPGMFSNVFGNSVSGSSGNNKMLLIGAGGLGLILMLAVLSGRKQ